MEQIIKLLVLQPVVPRQEPRNRRLPTAGLADDPERLALVHVEADPVDGVHDVGGAAEDTARESIIFIWLSGDLARVWGCHGGQCVNDFDRVVGPLSGPRCT